MKIRNIIVIIAILIDTTFLFAATTQDQYTKVLPEFQKIAIDYMKTSHTPGMVVVIVQDNKIIYLKGFGVRKVGTNEFVDDNTVFQIASVSKPFTSTALAALVGKNILNWNTKIQELDPEFQLSDPWVSAHLTLHDLLSHQSGLPDHAGDILEDLGYSQKAILHRLRFISPLNAFRNSYAYTNFGYSEAAFAAAKSQKLTWQQLMSEELFKPLGMNHTSTLYQDYYQASNKAINHIIVDGKASPLYQRDPDAQAPAGGVSTTGTDIAKWLMLQLSDGKYEGKQIINAEALNATHLPQVLTNINPFTGKAVFYGYGWIVSEDSEGEKTLSHSGAFSLGVRSQVYLVPVRKLGIAVLSNAAMTGLPEAVTMAYIDLVTKGKLTRDWLSFFNKIMLKTTETKPEFDTLPKNVYPSLPLKNYTGIYSNAYFGKIRIFIKDEKLNLEIGPKQEVFILHHWDRDVFYLITRGEMQSGKTAVVFTIGKNDIAKKVTINAWNQFNTGTFLRI